MERGIVTGDEKKEMIIFAFYSSYSTVDLTPDFLAEKNYLLLLCFFWPYNM